MNNINRVFLIVLDSVGVGFLPDAEAYGDLGANTLGHIGEAVNLSLPNMQALGLGNIIPIKGVDPTTTPKAAWGKAKSKSKGKDTTIGHWEIAGIIKDSPLPTWPQGIPLEISQAFEQKIGRKTLANSVASGTEIIAQFGDEHVKTGFPICYTSADSVFQIAAHESIVPLEQLYQWCSIARSMLDVGRVIARPFTGTSDNYQRTANRHDYSLEPPGITILDKLFNAGQKVVSIGKISDIFAGRGISENYPVKSNKEGIEKTIELSQQKDSGLVFTNLVDFDMKYGHRRDVKGYRDALEEFDTFLPQLLNLLREDELVIITADHGCDPIFKGTDHTREHIPLLVYGPQVKPENLGTRESFSDIASSISDMLLKTSEHGSFAQIIL